jgi:3-oxoacyl-[acyl-carrier-protein] synthase III
MKKQALSMKTTGSRSLRMSTEEPASPVEIPKTTISQAMARSNPGRSWFKCKTIGIGSMAGQESLPNSIFESLVDTNDKWISKRTGIRNRHVIKEGSSLKDLAIESAKQALESSGVAGEDIDLVIYASSTPDDLFGDAPGIAMAIGASKAAAFDLTAACSGFVYGMVTASQFLHSGTYKKVLVVGGDALTRYLDWTDRGTCILFGDGSGAVVMEATDSAEESGMLGFALHSDGTRGCNLRLPYNNKFEALSNEAGSVVDQGSYGKMYMNGAEVYKFAVSEVPVVIAEALKNSVCRLGI